MSNELTLGVKLAGKLQDALRRNNIGDLADIDWLASGDNMAKIRQVRLGHGEIIIPEHTVDCDASPFIPGEEWSVEEHQKNGIFKYSVVSIKLYLDEGQKDGGSIKGSELRNALVGKSVLNANVLDYLLANQHLILEEWKGIEVYFWGTIYRLDGNLYVRYLFWENNKWKWGACWLGEYYFNQDFVAISKN